MESAWIQYILCWFYNIPSVTVIMSKPHRELIKCGRTTPTAAGQQIISTKKSYNFPLFSWRITEILFNRTQKQMWNCFCSCQKCVFNPIFNLFHAIKCLFNAEPSADFTVYLLPVEQLPLSQPLNPIWISIPAEIAFPRRIPPEDLNAHMRSTFSRETH